MAGAVTDNPTLNPYTGPIELVRPHFVSIDARRCPSWPAYALAPGQ